ncbi:MAG: hypothetical protein JW909_00420 [Planctomycetes bacterium]|nr:hypothetical protein [Planctomycetota bacterium]
MGEPEDRSLGRLLVDAGLITPKQLEEALAYQKSIGGRLGRILVKLGALMEDKLLQFVADQQGLEVISLKGWEPDTKLLSLAPRDFWENHGILPYAVEHSTLKVAMSDASDIPAIDDLRFTTSLEVVPVLASERELQTLINKHFYKDGEAASRKRAPRVDVRDIAREVEARGAVRGEREHMLADLLNTNPARLVKAMASLLVKKGVLDPEDLSSELEETT